jgi:excisionase family DNA binding protein
MGAIRDRVDLEPAYRPLFGKERVKSGIIDDGRVPGLFERLKNTVQRPTGRPTVDRPTPVPHERTGDLVEVQVLLPPKLSVSDAASHGLLRGLSASTRHLAFEIVGLPDRVVPQFVCDGTDLSLTRGSLRSCLPDVRLVERRDFLFDEWFARDRFCAGCSFGLSDRVFRPLRLDHDLDALSEIVAVLDDLAEGELGLIQVLFAPAVMPWGKDLLEFASSIEDQDGVLPLIKIKFSEPTFATVMRISALAPKPDAAIERLRRLEHAVRSTTRSAANELTPLESRLTIEEEMMDVLERQSRRRGMLLSLSELATLAHVPSGVHSLKLLRATARSKAAPKVIAERGLVLGTNEHDGKVRAVALSSAQRLRHFHCIGSSGSGKSTLLLSMAIQDIEQGNGFAVLDPHGDLVDDIMARIPESRAKDVVLFDPSDEDFPVGFNVLSAHSELERTLLASDFVAVFKRLASTTFGDQMVAVLSNAVLAILESEQGGTLFDLRRFLSDKNFRTQFLKSVKDDEVLHYWRTEFPLLKGTAHSPILTRLNTFLRPKVLRYMVAQRENRLDLRAIMDSRKILLAKLSHGLVGEENSHLLGSLLVAKIAQAAVSRQDEDASRRQPFFLYLDEFHHFVTPSVASILSGARKYGLGLVLAHQEVRQIRARSEEVASSLLANAFTRVVFQVGEQDAKALADGFVYFEAADLQRLSVGHAIARVERTDFDFNLETLQPTPVPYDVGGRRVDAVRSFSRSAYARPREEIEVLLRTVSAPVETPDEESKPEPPTKQPTAAKPKPESVQPVPLPGRGGVQHKYLQSLVRKIAEDRGFEAHIEKTVLDGHGHVDVALEYAELRVACELSVTTRVAHEVGNLTKCLAAGFDYAILVSTDLRILQLARDEVTDSGDDRIRLSTLDELGGVLDDISGAPTPKRRKPTVSAPSQPEPLARKGFEGRRMLTTKDAASYLGLAVQTLAKLRVTGGSPPFYKFGRQVLYDRAELDHWIEERRRRSTSDVTHP